MKKELVEIGKVAVKVGVKTGVKLLEARVKPYMVTALVFGAWSGALPSRKVSLEKPIKCSSCKEMKKELTIIDIPWTGGKVKICKDCEEREYAKIDTWFSRKKRKRGRKKRRQT